MENLNENAFVKTTIDTYKDPHLEYLIHQSKKRNEEIKGLTQNPNKLVKIMTWTLLIILMIIMVPLIVCGVATKGFTWENQKYFALATIFIVTLLFIKHYV